MKGRFLSALALILFCLPGMGTAKEKSQGEWQKVQKVFDGDTFRLKNGEKVRLLGIDSPELHPSDKLYRDAERSRQDIQKIQEMGKKSWRVTERLIGGRSVRLELDKDTRDKYGRTLAYVYFKMKEGRFAEIVGAEAPAKGQNEEKEYLLNRELLRYGWADAYRSFDYKRKKEFLDLERQARQAGRGLWKTEK